MARVIAYYGSGVPPIGSVRAGAQEVIRELIGRSSSATGLVVDTEEFVGDHDVESIWLTGSILYAIRSFYKLVKTLRNDDVLVLAGGGTGAARLTTKFRPKKCVPDQNPIIIGMSDGCIFPIMAWFMGYERCFYAHNMACHDDDELADLCRALDEIYNPRITTLYDSALHLGWKLESVSYRLFPACTRPFIQIQGRTRQHILKQFSSEPYFLMLEDNYPGSMEGDIAFYEDLTLLTPYLEAVYSGGGAVSFGPVSNGAPTIITDYLYQMSLNIPVFYNVPFGHIVGPREAIQYGHEAWLRYDEPSGLHVTLVTGDED